MQPQVLQGSPYDIRHFSQIFENMRIDALHKNSPPSRRLGPIQDFDISQKLTPLNKDYRSLVGQSSPNNFAVNNSPSLNIVCAR